MKELGQSFQVRRPEIDEQFTGPNGAWQALRLATQKAWSLAPGLVGTAIAADTVVEVGSEILGKPIDADDALRMLQLLSGSTHGVHTGVAILHGASGALVADVVTTRVTMREITPNECHAYVASGEPFDKAGGYAVQESGDQFVTKMDGPWDNVVGLPMQCVRNLLATLAAAV